MNTEPRQPAPRNDRLAKWVGTTLALLVLTAGCGNNNKSEIVAGSVPNTLSNSADANSVAVRLPNVAVDEPPVPTVTVAVGEAPALTTSSVAVGEAPAPPSTQPSLSGEPMPHGIVQAHGHNWQPLVEEDFLIDAPTGSINSTCANPDKVTYTGATGAKWTTYPSCWTDTYQERAYAPGKVLSVSGGALIFTLHSDVKTPPAGATFSPNLPNGSKYMTGGYRMVVRSRESSSNTAANEENKRTYMFWPAKDSDYKCAENDFPEGKLAVGGVDGFSHNCNLDGSFNNPDNVVHTTIDLKQWHTFETDVLPATATTPAERDYFIDGKLVGKTTHNVWAGAVRANIQLETNTLCDQVIPSICHEDAKAEIDYIRIDQLITA